MNELGRLKSALLNLESQWPGRGRDAQYIRDLEKIHQDTLDQLAAYELKIAKLEEALREQNRSQNE